MSNFLNGTSRVKPYISEYNNVHNTMSLVNRIVNTPETFKYS